MVSSARNHPEKILTSTAGERRGTSRDLFNAAPDLYEALKSLLADITEYQTINHLGGHNNHSQRMARAALAKAEGRS